MQAARVPPPTAAPSAPYALMAQALDHFIAGRLERARDLYLQALAGAPEDPVCLHHLGIIAHQQGLGRDADRFIARAVAAKPDYADAHANHGAVLRTLGRPQEAIAALQRALAIAPEMAQAHNNLGSVLEDEGRDAPALAAYRQACRLNGKYVDAFVNVANLLRKLERHAEALAVCNDLVLQRPDAAAAHVALGRTLTSLQHMDEGLAAFDHALRLQPDLVGAHIGRGTLLLNSGRQPEAVDAFAAAVAADPANVPALFSLAIAHENADDVAEALVWYRKALALDPDLVPARAQVHHMRRYVCDWEGLEADEAELIARLWTTTDRIAPFVVVSLSSGHDLQLRMARLWTKNLRKIASPYAHAPDRAPARATRRLRIGYLSADFYSHATANLMAELFERHDRDRFDIVAYSSSPDDGSEMRARLLAAFDRFVDIRALSDREAADRIHADGIDILVELKGFTRGTRLEIVALKPAPIQVSFIGFPGTSGCDFMDYVLADPIVLPMSEQPHYCERIVQLPDCYQPNDTRRQITAMVPTRAACGLPDRGFVFCCFNNTYKITPRFFDLWMRLLAGVPGSVLWLFDANAAVKANLRAAAAARGIDPDRLVFAPRLTKPDHLARQRLADLFLDTLPYNAHTTASDALWTGLPVVTCLGSTFAGRVAASLLHAIGLPELVTDTLAAYEALALALARDPGRLAALRRTLAANRLTAPLFDTPRFARHVEAAFDRMWALFAAGEAPQPFAVAPLDHGSTAALPAASGPARTLYAACPLCDTAGSQPVLGANVTAHRLYRPGMAPSVAWHTCPACDHVFAEGYFDAATRAAFAADLVPADTLGHDMEICRPAALRSVDRVARHTGRGSWLDVGFGNGALLFAAEEAGFHPVGLDGSERAAADLRTLGYLTVYGTLGDLPPELDLAVVSLSNGLHREPFPRDTLRQARARLRVGGALLVSVPNKDTMLWRMLHASGANPHWRALDAAHVFGRARIETLLAAEGFRPVAYGEADAYRSGMEIVALKT